ncbi:hypothetical protein [Thalassobius sp. Cn5-15]|uniref:hypothetical protein n=1 Tax=Thalassobius sp. Cn5-15 TaxID=2917763 RepID=UPI001EF28DDC|nr:hypothetical protein [Thalassobius sp. Cn5-15]MCG7495219.1 hypothetical protein [Thalassobius sp. Cn5-15]
MANGTLKPSGQRAWIWVRAAAALALVALILSLIWAAMGPDGSRWAFKLLIAKVAFALAMAVSVLLGALVIAPTDALKATRGRWVRWLFAVGACGGFGLMIATS